MSKNKKSSSAVYPGDAEWRAESDMRTLASAEEIKRDPKRLAAAKAYARKKLEEMASVATTSPIKD